MTTTDRIANFGAGPAALPESVLRQAQKDIWNIQGSGIGILEHSHRGSLFDRILTEAEAEIRSLAAVPDNYKVLFIQGGASTQFTMVPMNLLAKGRPADYLITGAWSKKAIKEAKLFGEARVALSGEDSKFTTIPPADTAVYSKDACYVHVTTNNTIFGTQWKSEPPVPADVPLIADASSDIFSRPIDVSRYGMIYAGAQKNLGPSGIVLVLIRDDLVEQGPKDLPTMFQYRTFANERSLYNTPPTFAIYMVGEVVKWIRDAGGLTAMAERNEEKAGLLYDFLDQSAFYTGTADTGSRSLMNVCFRSPSAEHDTAFVKAAGSRGLEGLKGHRSAGGMRASIYNACRREDVVSLVEFMKEFEREHS